MGKPEQIPPGGEPSALDMSNERDRGMARQAMKNWPKRWRGINEARKEEFVGGLAAANDKAKEILGKADDDTALAAASTIASIVRTAAMMEGQNQTDEHLEDKNARIDSGKATDNVAFTPPAVYDVPLPDAIRKRLTGAN